MKPERPPTLGLQLTLAARLYRTRLARALQTEDLFPGQEQVLRALGEAPEGLRMGDLARALQVRPPTLTKTIQRLESQRLIARSDHAGDARVVRLSLTPAGQDKLARVAQAEDALEAELSALFKSKAETRLRKSLRRLARHLAPGTAPALDPENNSDADET